jgi:hypothetical protein
MSDFSVTGIVTIDNTQSILSIDEVMTAADKATAKLATLRRKALSTISMTMGMINQAYGALKQLVGVAGGMIDPMFDMLFSMVSSIVSTAVTGALMLMSTLNPALIAVGLTLMVISLELNIKAQMDLHESKGTVANFLADMKMSIARSTHAEPFQPSSGSGF